MAQSMRKVKVRYRSVWTVYYDLARVGHTTSENFASPQLALEDATRTLRAWLKEDRLSRNEKKAVKKLLDEGSLAEASHLRTARLSGVAHNSIWIERTRLILSRTPVEK